MTTTKLSQGLRGAAFTVFFAQAVACGSDKEGAAADPGFGTANLVGTWKSDCLALASGSEVKTITFTTETFSFDTTTYTDAACATKDNVLAGTGLYKLDGSTAVPLVGNAVNINYGFLSYTWTFIAQPLRAVDYAKACASTSISGRVDILGKTCALDAAAPTVFSSPAFGTLAPEGATLILSDFSTNGATPLERSTQGITLGKKLGWTKQPDAVE